MKPKIFIGSSSERLDLAYSIQQNLDNDAQITVWTQGVFKLSNSSLDSLLSSLDNFDFAIFVFHPDDVTQIRGKTFDTVRDNLIFELGMFIGRLGKERVFFLVPKTIDQLHLPTDLLGINPGIYDNTREDGNLLASLGPFCNQIRNFIKVFVLENIEDIQDEPVFIKTIVIEKQRAWEYLFAAELMKHRLTEINNAYADIDADSAIFKFKSITGEEFFLWLKELLTNLDKYTNLLVKCLEGLHSSFGPLGVPGKPLEIKNAVERFCLLCKEILNIEYELYGLNPPQELEHLKKNLKGFTKTMYMDEINRLHTDMKSIVHALRNGGDAKGYSLILTPKFPQAMHEAISEFKKYFGLM